MIKEIYSFNINKKTKVEITEDKEDGSKVIRTEEKLKPNKIVIKTPSRTEVQASEFEYAKEYGRLFRAGIMTKEMVKKTYDSDGFISSKRERGMEIVKQLNDLQSSYQEIYLKEDKDEVEKSSLVEIQKDWDKLSIELRELEASVEGIFSNTAEVFAEQFAITYLTLCLTGTEDNGSFKPFFKGDDHLARLKHYDAMIESGDSFYTECAEKAALIVSLYYSGKAATKEDFDAIFPSETQEEVTPVVKAEGENEKVAVESPQEPKIDGDKLIE